jgi:hypothetical protein
MRFVGTFVVTVALAGCGSEGATGPGPLVPDPAVVTTCAPGPVPAGATRAKPIACAEELIGGRLAGGRLGDFLLENDRVRVIVRAGGDGYYLHGTHGGGVVDAAVVGGEDLVKELIPAVDFTVGAFDELVITEAGDDAAAELVVRGPAAGLDVVTAALGTAPPAVVVEHHYRLAAGASALELETRAFPAEGAAPVAPTLYDAMFFGGRVRAFLPGTGWAEGTGSAAFIASAGTTTSYGLVYPADAAPPRLIDLAGIRLMEGPGIDASGQRRWLVLGDGSVASVTERAWTLLGVGLGRVVGTAPPGTEVVVADPAGAPITVARADAAGTLSVALPAGSYVLHAEAAGRTPGAEVAVTVAAGADTPVQVPAGTGGTIAITVRDTTGAAIPARVVVEQAGERTIGWAGATGEATVPVAPGTWRVAVSRGLEYDAFVADPVIVADGQTVTLAPVLERVVDTAGWIALDTHLHSELSTDSTLPIDDRLRAVAAEGIELPVATDHDFVTDYAPIIAELGLEAWVGALEGVESSSLIIGHINAFPITPDLARTGRGAPRWIDRAPSQVFADLRAGDSNRIVQCNHPRRGTDNLFDVIDLDPVTLTARRDPTHIGLPAGTDLSDLGFDAIELVNSKAEEDVEEVFLDYLAMVAAGHPAAATGSSDSHGASAFAGTARTYVWVGPGADDPATVDPVVVTDAIRARRVVIGTGAFVTAGIVGPSGVSLPGDAVDVTGMPEVTLRIRVQAPPWQPLARVRIFEGTQQVASMMLDPTDTASERYAADVALPAPAADTFYVVRVDGAGRGDPVLGDPLPAFTNPLFATVAP